MEAVHSDDVTGPGCVAIYQTRKKNGQGRECFAPGCNNTQLDKDGNPSGIHFFRFPQDEPRRKQWCRQIQRQDTIDEITANSVLCEQHFKKDDIRRTPYGANRYFLKKDSIPQQIDSAEALPRRGRKAARPQRYEDFIPSDISPVGSPRRGRKAAKPQRYENMGKSGDGHNINKTKDQKTTAIDVNNEVRPKTQHRRDQNMIAYSQNKISRSQENGQMMSPMADPKYRQYNAVMTKLELQSDWLNKMNKLRKEGVFCDVHLDINGRAIKAHRVVLSACSPLFHKQLATGGTLLPPDEAYTVEFVQALETVIEFAYTAEIHLTVENVQHIMQIAFHYQILPLVDMCSSFLGQFKEHSNHVRAMENGFNREESPGGMDQRNHHGDESGSDLEMRNSDEYDIAGIEQRSLNSIHAVFNKQPNGVTDMASDKELSSLVDMEKGLTSLVDMEAGYFRLQDENRHSYTAINAQHNSSKDNSIQLRQLLLNRLSTKSSTEKDKDLTDRDQDVESSTALNMWSGQFDGTSWKQFSDDSPKTKGTDEEDPNSQGTLFLCVDCGKSFTSKSKLIKHEKCHSKDVFRCKHCFEKFPWKHALDQHILLQHPNAVDSQESNSNDAQYPSNAMLADGCYGDSEVEADSRDGKDKIYFCSICGRGFSERYRQMRHEKIHTREKPFKCSQCEKVYSRKDNLDRHFFVQHLIRDRESKIPLVNDDDVKEGEESNAAMETASPQDDVKEDNTDVPEIQVEDSSPQVLRESPSKEQKEQVSEKSPYRSDQNYVNVLTNFMTPKPSKQHVCLVCGKEFTNKYRLVRHEVIHTGERPYKCEICNRKFTRKDHMERHKSRQHPNGELGIPSKKGRKPKSKADQMDFEIPTGVPDFQCGVCGMVFQNKKSLMVHKQCHEFVDCKGCRTIFLSEEDFRTHQCIGDPVRYSPQPGPSSLHQMDIPT